MDPPSVALATAVTPHQYAVSGMRFSKVKVVSVPMVRFVKG